MTGTAAKIAEAARLLHEARLFRRPVAALPAHLSPSDEAEARATHEAVVALSGPVVAWKVGAPTPDAEPAAGMIAADTVHASPCVLPRDAFRLGAVEAEIAVTLGRDLPAREAPYSAEEALAAVATWHAAIEMLDTAFVDWAAAPALDKFADRMSHGALILGPAVGQAPAGPLADLPVRLVIDGEERFAHRGGNTGGDPTRLFVWLANARRNTSRFLKAGDVVTTGSATPFLRLAPGQSARAEFEGLGRAELSLTG